MIAAENWCVKVDDKIYGPYTSAEIRKYAHAGRLAASSLIAPAGSRAWREAQKETTFAGFFGARPSVRRRPSGQIFGRRDGAANDAAEKSGATDIANFVVIFDVANGAAGRLGAAISGLGPAFRITDNVWNVTCDLTAVGVRNAIAPYLSPRESIFVIDTTRGRASWQNYLPEMHAKISAAYMAARSAERAQAS